MDDAVNSQAQKLKASIRIARENLYVFRDSKEREKWENLLNEAEEARVGGELVYAEELVGRVDNVVDALWKRIERWQTYQTKLTKCFLVLIALQLIGVVAYLKFYDVAEYELHSSMLFGLLGGTVSVSLSLGQELDVAGSNRLAITRLVFRPMVGVISALIACVLLKTEAISIAKNIDQGAVLILLSFFAGYSERFLTRTLSHYSSKVFNIG